MEQSYIPNINVRATPGMCLQYIDDAGESPLRSPTAKAAYKREEAGGRIRTDQFPENVWVVAWFEFTKGSYRYPNGVTINFSDAWHIAFMKRVGNRLEIHDSEVHSGARQPYRALGEVEAWFKVYGARYVGWSTDCDGRNYAKEEKVMKFNEGDRKNKNDALYGTDLGRFKFAVGMEYKDADYAIMKSDEFKEDALLNKGDIENLQDRFKIKIADTFVGRPSKKLLYELGPLSGKLTDQRDVAEKLDKIKKIVNE